VAKLHHIQVFFELIHRSTRQLTKGISLMFKKLCEVGLTFANDQTVAHATQTAHLTRANKLACHKVVLV